MNKETIDWVTLRHGICPRYTCVSMNTLQEYENGTVVGCSLCGYRIRADKFYKLCKKKTFGYYQVKNKSRSEEECMHDICQLQ